MQAIILAAGLGKRLGDLTRENTKCMISVNGVRLIDRMLSQLSKYSLNRVVIVIGYKGDKLKNHIGNNYSKLRIEYIENPVYDKTNNIYSLSLAKQYLVQDDTLLLESDLIYDDLLFERIIENKYPNLVLVDRYQPWMDGTMVRIDEYFNITNFIPKKDFKYNEIASYYKTVNIYKFSKEFSISYYVPFLEAYCHAMGNNEYYEQVLRVITFLDKVELKALIVNDEKWYEIDDVQDLDVAETLFAQKEEQLIRYESRYGGYWRFPKLLDFCYLVNPFFPSERLKDELRSNFDVLISGYPSGLTVNSLNAGKYFGVRQDYICVGNGASELIKSLIETLVGKIGIIYPTFEEYPNRISQDRIVKFVSDNNDFSYTALDLISFYEKSDIKTLLLINPDNPSGNFILRSEVLMIADWAKVKEINLIVDESFVDFTDTHEENSLLKNPILERYPNMIVIKSISKSYGIPGLRLGIIASGDSMKINKIKKSLPIWNINSFAEFYLQIFNKYEEDYLRARIALIRERERFYDRLRNISYIRVIKSNSNYFLCELGEGFNSRAFSMLLLSDFNILIKDCSRKYPFNGQNYIRIAIRKPEENDFILNVLRKLDKN